MAGPSGPGNGPAPAANRGNVVRTSEPEESVAAPARPAAAPAVAPSESPARGASEQPEHDNRDEGEDATENVIVSPEEITASRRDGTNTKRRLSGDACIDGFDKNAVGFFIL